MNVKQIFAESDPKNSLLCAVHNRVSHVDKPISFMHSPPQDFKCPTILLQGMDPSKVWL